MTSQQLFYEELRRRAADQPNRLFLRDAQRTLNYGEALEALHAVAGTLAAGGLRQGQRCIIFMENGLDYILTWLALSRLGVISVPLNQSLRGPLLSHQVHDVAAAAVVADPAHWAKISDIDGLADSFAYIFRADEVAADGQGGFPAQAVALHGPAQHFDDLTALPEVSDVISIFYTSGTTGPSKGVTYTHLQAWQTGQTVAQYLSASDVFYMTNPMCHVCLPHCLGAALFSGGTLAVRPKFSARLFWDDVRLFGATVTMMLGAVAPFVAGMPVSADDRRHPLRKVLMVPVLQDVQAFCERFDVAVMSWFNMTEVSVPLHAPGFSATPGSDCGVARPGACVRVVDAHDRTVPPGVTGELVVRDDQPWLISPGYLNNVAATVESWRNQWFHTGDLFVQDANGSFRFLDRMKDRIRRRGENISSFEVEAQVLTHPAVHEAAVVGVDTADGEQEVKVVAVLHPGQSLDPAGLLDFLQPLLPHFCVPRYVLFSDAELPKTSTGKVRKNVLREAGAALGWDREASGYKVVR
jgi:crotonobetaine/carnitine-CoA ligase